MAHAQDQYSLIVGLAWPVLAALAVVLFFDPIRKALYAAAENVKKGAAVTGPGGLGVGQPPLDEKKVNDALTDAYVRASSGSTERRSITGDATSGPGPTTGDVTSGPGPTTRTSGNDLLSDAYLALFSTSFWRKDKSTPSQKWWQIEVIILGPEAALDQIESVKYLLDPAYEERSEQTVGADQRASSFKLKELANGYSIVRADITFKNKQPPLRLNRFINIVDDGPRI